MARVPVFLIVVLLSALAAAASGTRTLEVRTPDGRPVPQAALVLHGPGGTREVVAGPGGDVRLDGLPPGSYRIELATPGFVVVGDASVEVAESDEVVRVVLAPAAVREDVTVVATRTPAPLSTVGASATVVDAARIEERRPADVLDLLEEIPGVDVARAGGPGAASSAFVRGGESRFTRVLIDGVPVNEPGGYHNFGMTVPLELDRLEVVRGAASSLYGTDALAGAMLLVTHRARPGEAPDLRIEAGGGSFDRRSLMLGTSGAAGPLDWNVGASRLETAGDLPNSAFDLTAGAASVGVALGGRASLRIVARRQSGTVGTPGPAAYGRPDLDAYYDRSDTIAGLALDLEGETVTQQVHVGFSRARQLSVDPIDSGPYVPSWHGREGAFEVFDFPNAAGYLNDTRRLLGGYQAEIRTGSKGVLTVGAEVERESGEVGDRRETLLSPARTGTGAYAQQRLLLGRAFVTLGARLEHNEDYGTRLVPRAAVSVRLHGGEDATTLHASAGAGIKEPSFLEAYGVSFYARGNPDLDPERSRTFDLGVEQRLLSGRLKLGATAFRNDYFDQIAFRVVDPETFEGTFTNLGHTRARGVELEVEAAPGRVWHVGASYTYLDGEIVTSSSEFDPVYAAGRSLLRRPRHSGSVWVAYRGARLRAGADLVAVGARADSDFVGLGLESNPGYARVDARLGWAFPAGLEAYVAAANLLDRDYQEVLGYPAPGRSVRLGISVRIGRRDGSGLRPPS